MPAVRKLTPQEVLTIKYDAINYAPVKMTRDMHRKCKEQNVARFNAQLDGTYEKGSR